MSDEFEWAEPGSVFASLMCESLDAAGIAANAATQGAQQAEITYAPSRSAQPIGNNQSQ